MTEAPRKPAPPENELSQPYWEAASRGQLLLQGCGACGTLRHYPRLLCDQCYSDEVIWKEASGRGTIHSWTVAHHAFHPAFAGELPYTIVTIDLEEGPRALGRWHGPTPNIGQAAEGRFEISDGTPNLVFRPAEEVRSNKAQ